MRTLFIGLLLVASTVAPAMATFVPPTIPGAGQPLPPVVTPGEKVRPIARIRDPLLPFRPVVRPPVLQPAPGEKRPLPAQVPPRNVIVIPDCRFGPC